MAEVNDMQYQHYHLGYRTKGETVEIRISRSSNVRLMDHANFEEFRHGRQYTSYGGHYRVSPVSLSIRNTGRWHVVIDLGGLSGTVDASVRVL